MFILLIDLFDRESHWGPLLDAIRIARARHHDVLVVSAWPTEFTMPATGIADETRLRPSAFGSISHASALAEQYFRSHERLSHELSRVGVTLALARLEEAVPEVLRRVENMRHARIPVHR